MGGRKEGRKGEGGEKGSKGGDGGRKEEEGGAAEQDPGSGRERVKKDADAAMAGPDAWPASENATCLLSSFCCPCGPCRCHELSVSQTELAAGGKILACD